MRVTGLTCRSLRFPLHRSWDDGVTHNGLVVVRVTTDSGVEGTGFGWTPRVGASAVRALLEDECAGLLLGREAVPAARWRELYDHLHEAGPGGIAAMALGAVDIALWDLRARSFGVSLVDLIGRQRDRAPVYGSGVNLDYELEELRDQVRRWLAAGHEAVKIKVGSADLERDLERVAAVRSLLGPHRKLMIDANQRWDLPTAARALKALAEYDPYWIEEPLRADDVAGHQRLRSMTALPFAVGENLRTIRQFRDMLVAGVCDIAQPNAVRVGGITPLLKVADLTAAFSVPVAPHLLPEVSGQLALCLPMTGMVEDIERASFADLGALEDPSGVEIQAPWVRASTGPGHGLSFVAEAPATTG